MMNDYYKLMARDGRVINIAKNEAFATMLTFSICNHYEPYRDKGLWDYLPHNPKGNICFIEKLISFDWSRETLRMLEEIIVNKYPTIELAVWFRPTISTERKVTYKVNHETSLRY